MFSHLVAADGDEPKLVTQGHYAHAWLRMAEWNTNSNIAHNMNFVPDA